MKESISLNQLIIVLTEHSLLGMLLIPYMGEKKEDGIIHLTEQAFHATSKGKASMNQVEKQAIDIASHYTDKYLMEVYSREKNTSKFLRKLSEEPKKVSEIRLFIDKKLQEMLDLIQAHNLPLYQKQSGSNVLYPHHAYHVNQQPVETRFSFKADQETFSYQLRCFYDKEPISLTEHKPVVILTTKPATLLLGMELYRFSHIESSRINPFTNKSSISVKIELIEKYIDTIVLPLCRYHEISVEGLPLIEEKRKCEALLYLEDTVLNSHSLRLEFRYGKECFSPSTTGQMKKIAAREELDGKPAIRYYERDTQAETEALRILSNAHLQGVNDALFELQPDAPEKSIIEWVSQHEEMLQKHFILTSSQQQKPYSFEEIRIEQSYEDGPDWFDLHITAVIGKLRIPFSRFRNHILEDKREYILPDGRLILLPEEWFSKYANLMEVGEDHEKNIRLKRPFVGIVQSLLSNDPTPNESAPSPLDTFPIPSGLKAELRPYQLKGFSWIMRLNEQGFNGCLADDMGLGKTLQTLTVLQAAYPQTDATSSPRKAASLIVVPTSLMYNWRKEAQRFTSLSVAEYNSSIRFPENRPEHFFDRFHLVLTTYGTMRNNIEALKEYPFEYIVLDESQNIKNSESQTFRSATQLQGNHRLVLTGTPIENSLKDLWAQFRFLQPELLSDEADFTHHFVNPIKQGDPRTEERLRQIISPFILRRTKSEVTPELPPLTEEVIYCGMTDAQNELYQQEKNSLRNILLQSSNIQAHHSLTVLNGITRLRQLSCHPQMIIPDFNEISGKTEQIIETFEMLKSEGHKVLIFSSFVKHLELLIEEFKKHGWQYSLLTGSTGNRQEEIDRFNRNKEIQAFFISLKAGGVGLNLTEADYVFIIDPWWNPASETQAIARAHRTGQNKQVIAYRFITQESIEEKIIRLQEEKRKLAATFIAENELGLTLTDHEWNSLLK